MFKLTILKTQLLIIFLGLFSGAQAYQMPNNITHYLQKMANSFQFLSKEKKSCIALITLEADLIKAKKIINKLLELRNDTNIKGLILHIDCCGGLIGTCQAIFSELKKFKEKKPVIVIVENCCFSGAYYVATATDYIFALPSSEIGGIGIISFIKKYKDIKFTENQISATMEPIVIRYGKYKDPANAYTSSDEELIEDIKQRAWKKYYQFVSDIAQARNLSLEDEKIWADGKSFVGTEAIQLGLIDALGDFSDAIGKMRELLKHRGVNLPDNFELIDVQV
jgi:protease IV